MYVQIVGNGLTLINGVFGLGLLGDTTNKDLAIVSIVLAFLAKLHTADRVTGTKQMSSVIIDNDDMRIRTRLE
jgi:hypothetical protein